MARTDQVADGIYRISTWTPAAGITFNQFLIVDERPALVHTGMHGDYQVIRQAISEVLDPASLAHVILLHFEADECGGMDRFLEAAPDGILTGSALSAALNLSGWSYRGRFQGLQDGQTLDLGRHRLRVLETPHVHHWDSMMLFDETTRSLFPSDLFIQPGEQPPVVSEDLSAEMCELYRASGIFAHEDPVRQVVGRVERLQPDRVHAMHGGTLTREAFPRFVKALREQPFAYTGRLLGRRVAPEM
jgi:flavorubredoxin